MKKLIFSILLLLGTKEIQAQTLTFKLGPTFSKMQYRPYSYTKVFDKFHLGYTANLGIDFLEKKYFHLNANLGLINIGGRGYLASQSDDEGIYQDDYNASLTYIAFGAKACFKYPFKAGDQISLSVGPRIDVFTNLNESNDFLLSYKMSKDLNLYNYGLNIELAYAFKLSEKFMYKMAVEYNPNMLNLAERTIYYGTVSYSDYITLKYYSAFSLGLAYKL